MSYKIKLLYDAVGWAHWKRCEILREYAPDDFQVTTGCGTGPYSSRRYDLILQLCAGHVALLRQHLRSLRQDTLLVSGLNVGFTLRNKAWLEHNLRASDHVIINSRECWQRAGKPTRCSWISNGVDLRKWRLITPPERRAPTTIFLGSKFHTIPERDTKGYHRFLLPLGKELDKRGIAYHWRRIDSLGCRVVRDGKIVVRGADYLLDEVLLRWYNTATVYVVASSSEGTPNPALEAAACGATICATRVGNMPELIEPGINGELVDWDADAILAGVLRCQENYLRYSAAMQDTIKGWDWKDRAARYYDLFRRLLTNRDPSDLPQSSASPPSDRRAISGEAAGHP